MHDALAIMLLVSESGHFKIWIEVTFSSMILLLGWWTLYDHNMMRQLTYILFLVMV
jgi:hypothetical protein